MPGPRVALFVTCLVDMFRPSIGFATVKLLRDAGCEVAVPEAQTCCGQPAWNSGDKATAKAVARQVIAAFEGYDYVVAPSGSCAATIAKDYPLMLAGDAFDEALALNPAYVDALIGRGTVDYEAGRYAAAPNVNASVVSAGQERPVVGRERQRLHARGFHGQE